VHKWPLLRNKRKRVKKEKEKRDVEEIRGERKRERSDLNERKSKNML
jgi:hypothetical protein